MNKDGRYALEPSNFFGTSAPADNRTGDEIKNEILAKIKRMKGGV